MYIQTPEKGFWLNQKQIELVEEKYGAHYIGYWTVRNKKGNWTEEPVDCFYNPDPNLDRGHSNYFGMFTMDGNVYIVNAESAFEAPISGILLESGECLVSRYRNNFVEKDGCSIDGGRDYCRVGGTGKLVKIWCREGKFDIKEDTESPI